MNPILVDFPEDKARRFQEALDATSTIHPAWLHFFTVRNVSGVTNDTTVLMCINPQPEYRQANIEVFRTFWEHEWQPGELVHRVAHERFHLFVEPLIETALDVLNSAYPEDGPFKALAKARLTKALETVVEDLAVWWTTNNHSTINQPKKGK